MPGPVASQRSFLGVALDEAKTLLSAPALAAATTLDLFDPTGFTATGHVTIYDGANTETVSVTALASNVLTVSALGHPHAAGCLVVVTAAADAPADFIPVTSFTPADVITYIADTGFRGSMVDTYDEVQGPVNATYGTGGDVFADTIGWILAGFFGSDDITGASAPYAHVFTPKNTGNGQPKSLTFTDFDAIQSRAFPAMMVDSLSFMFNATQALTWTATTTGYASGEVADPVASFSTVRLTPSWQGACTVAGLWTPTLVSGQLDLKRKLTVVPTIAGTQNPFVVWVGPVTATGKLSFIAQDESELLDYLNNTQPAVTLDFLQGSGSTLTEVKFQMSKCAYTAATKARTTDYEVIDVTFTARANTTDAGSTGGESPVKVTLQNAHATSFTA